MGKCKGCESCDCGELETEEETAQAEWVEEQVGECIVEIAEVRGAVTGTQIHTGDILFPNIGIKATISINNTYSADDAEELALIMARVIRSYYVRTKLFDLLSCGGLEN